MSCTELTMCVACSSTRLEKFLDLNTQPLANNFTKEKIETEQYPLAVNYCHSCSHTQLTHSVDPRLLFENYIYESGTSTTLKKYFDWFAQKITRENRAGRKLLDIACNDGSLLNSFSRLGWKTWGVDPAKNLANKHSHKVIQDFWPCNIKETFDVIVAQNVLAHTPNAYEFLQHCRRSINPGGKIYIQTSQSQMYQNGEFDTIYHEHISFFSIESMFRLAARCGLYLNNVEITDIHGGSYLFTLSRESTVYNSVNMNRKEKLQGRNNFEFYKKFADNVTDICNKFKATVDDCKKKGYIVAGYGAAAKGMTFLNASSVELDFIIDDSPAKQHTYSPAFQIPVVGIDALEKFENVVIVPLAWNFFNEIKERVSKVKENVAFITYFPEVTTID